MAAAVKAVGLHTFPRSWRGYLLRRWHWLPLFAMFGGMLLVIMLGYPAEKSFTSRLTTAGLLTLCFSPLLLYSRLDFRAYRTHRNFHKGAELRVDILGLCYGFPTQWRCFPKVDVLEVVHYQSQDVKIAPWRPLGYSELWLRNGQVLCLSSELIDAGKLRRALPGVPWHTQTPWIAKLPDWAPEQGFGGSQTRTG
ncbi:hypothetical protein [Hymenobacter jeollabukensis]|uniref:PH domain-containing protein n=1 Tax=Hymenobacter jeollabukensis TaxID=2025313 RepID=A0A5R8WPY9_9BACT|nr:hypothetical protein [Hymenobacter jeollabukensis]TLM91802.1 hypothetical protein FDY95_14690 [Hymenobacter jeollabukensis]